MPYVNAIRRRAAKCHTIFTLLGIYFGYYYLTI